MYGLLHLVKTLGTKGFVLGMDIPIKIWYFLATRYYCMCVSMCKTGVYNMRSLKFELMTIVSKNICFFLLSVNPTVQTKSKKQNI